MGKHFGKRIYKLHKWSGLLAGLVIVILGLSGSVLVFHDELEAYAHRDVLTVPNAAPVDVDRALKTITGQYKNWEVRLQAYSPDPARTLVFSLRRPLERLTVFVHPATGVVLETVNTNKTVVTWILTLHYSLHAQLAGEIVIFLAGIAFLISILTGLVIYRKSVLDVLLFRNRFGKKNRRSYASSLHRYVGVWALLLNLVLVITGGFISYEIISNAIKTGGSKKIAQTPRIPFSINKTLSDLKTLHPEFEPISMRFPTTEGLPVRINGRIQGESIFWNPNYNSALIDPGTGEIQNLKHQQNSDLSTQLSSISRSIHFLEFGNLLVKMLFCLAGLSAPVLSITGFLLWFWKKRGRKKTAVPAETVCSY